MRWRLVKEFSHSSLLYATSAQYDAGGHRTVSFRCAYEGIAFVLGRALLPQTYVCWA
jgi:hypothetical protein